MRKLVVAEVREPVFEGTKADRAMREYVSFGDDVEEALATEAISFLLEAEVPLLLFLFFGWRRMSCYSFGRRYRWMYQGS